MILLELFLNSLRIPWQLEQWETSEAETQSWNRIYNFSVQSNFKTKQKFIFEKEKFKPKIDKLFEFIETDQNVGKCLSLKYFLRL